MTRREPSSTAAVPGTLIGPPRTPLQIGTSVLPEELYEETWIADRAIDFVRKNRDRPWFLFVSMLKPHSEFVIPDPYATMYSAASMPLPSTFRPHAERLAPTGLDRNKRLIVRDPDVLRAVIAHYYGAVAMVDKHMGRVVDAVDDLGLGAETIVVFTSDHGNMLGERNRMFKGVMYESSVRVPLLLRASGRLPRGKVVDGVLDNTAIMPTLLDLAGIPAPANIQGRSLAAMARGERESRKGTAFSVLRHRMLRKGDWKLIDPYQAAGQVGPELYNVVEDPLEQNNLYGRGAVTETERALEAEMRTWWGHKPVGLFNKDAD